MDGFIYHCQVYLRPRLGIGGGFVVIPFLTSHISPFLYFSTSSPFLFKFSAGMGMGMGIGVVTNLAKTVLVEINVFYDPIQFNSIKILYYRAR